MSGNTATINGGVFNNDGTFTHCRHGASGLGARRPVTQPRSIHRCIHEAPIDTPSEQGTPRPRSPYQATAEAHIGGVSDSVLPDAVGATEISDGALSVAVDASEGAGNISALRMKKQGLVGGELVSIPFKEFRHRHNLDIGV